jgi:hypothetical protein
VASSQSQSCCLQVWLHLSVGLITPCVLCCSAHGQPADAAAGRALDDLDDDELLELQQQAAEVIAEAVSFAMFRRHTHILAKHMRQQHTGSLLTLCILGS